jgi:hypothetical protein
MLSSMAERKQQRMSRTAVLKLVRTFDYLRAVLVLAAFGGPPHMRRVFPTCRPWHARTHDRLWLQLVAHSGAPSELPFEIAQTPTGVASVPFLWCRGRMLAVPTVNQNSAIVAKFRRPTQSGSLPMLGTIALCWFRSWSAPVALA